MEGKDEEEALSFDVGRLTALGNCVGILEVVERERCLDLFGLFLKSNEVSIEAYLKHMKAANKYVL